jgi:aminoglycoside 6'-N-acetyltransferase
MDAIAQDEGLVIRRMRDQPGDYLLMVSWRNAPHVKEFWDHDLPELTLEAAIEEYRPDTAADSASTSCIIELDGRPVGFCQFYAWASYADTLAQMDMEVPSGWWGIDIFVGEPELVNQGIGTRAVRLLVDHLRTVRGAAAVALATELDNVRAIRAYEKAGFVKQGQVLDTDTKNGERPWCWWMVAR